MWTLFAHCARCDQAGLRHLLGWAVPALLGFRVQPNGPTGRLADPASVGRRSPCASATLTAFWCRRRQAQRGNAGGGDVTSTAAAREALAQQRRRPDVRAPSRDEEDYFAEVGGSLGCRVSAQNPSRSLCKSRSRAVASIASAAPGALPSTCPVQKG